MRLTEMKTESIDKIEILDLFSRFIIALDSVDVDGWVNCFTDDGTYESPIGTVHGKHELRNMVRGLHEGGTIEGKRHFSGPAIMDIHNDHATVTSYYFVVEVRGYPGIIASGTYIDELKKVNNTWKIFHRRQTVDPGWRPLRTQQEVALELSERG